VTLLQAHIALANALGDPFAPGSPNAIRDGVRYSAILRQSYIYRAMLKSMNTSLSQIIGQPRKVQSEVLQAIYPNYMRTVQFGWAGGNYATYPLPSSVAFVYSLKLCTLTNENLRPLYFSWQPRAKMESIRSSRHTLAYDPMYSISVNAGVTSLEVSLSSTDKSFNSHPDLLVEYLPVPQNQDLVAAIASQLDYDPLWHTSVVHLASLFAKADSQDWTELQQLVQVLL